MIKLSEKNQIIVRNKYYPDGLRENDAVIFHHKNKETILNEVGKNKIVLCIATDVNKYVIVRKIKNEELRLNRENFDYLIHPRVISIFKEISPVTNEWCIDIDAGKNTDEYDIKVAVQKTLDIFDELYELGWIKNKNYRITNTSTGYHVFGYLTQRNTNFRNYEMAKNVFEKLRNEYSKSRGDSDISIDLSVMKPRGCHIVVGSLNRNGLACLDISNKWKSFNRKSAIIKTPNAKEGIK